MQKEKASILRKLEQPKLQAPIRNTLSHKKKSLDQLFREVNKSILSGANDAVKVTHHQDGRKSWRLRLLEPNFSETDSFFSHLDQRSTVDVLYFVNSKTGFSKAFDSILPKENKRKQNASFIMASILGNAIRLGVSKMATISDLNESSLLSAEAVYIRTESVTAAIDRINNAASKLPIYKKWHINSTLHGSIDGLKVESSKRISKARYSSKYFGQGVGVSVYNEVVNSFSVAGKLIGANEYEGNFAFEMVHHQNTSDINPSTISTDKHYGDLGDQKIIIKPTKFVTDDFMVNEWDNVQRLVASLLSGNVSPSNLIRKLSTQNYYSTTKKALVQYNQIEKN